jgi:hypothetical protein
MEESERRIKKNGCHDNINTVVTVSSLLGPYDLEDEGTTILRNVPPDDMISERSLLFKVQRR